MTFIVIDVDLVEAFSAGTRAYLTGLPRMTFAHTEAERHAFIMGWDAGPANSAVDDVEVWQRLFPNVRFSF